MFHDPLHTGLENTFEITNNLHSWKNSGGHPQVGETLPQVTKYHAATAKPYINTLRTPRLVTVHIDLIGPLNTSTGFRYILTMRDRVTGFIVTAPLTDKSPA